MRHPIHIRGFALLQLWLAACGPRITLDDPKGASEGPDDDGSAAASHDDSGPVGESGDDAWPPSEDEGCVPIVCEPDSGCGSIPDGCGSMVECGACPEGTRVEGVRAARLIADRSRGTLLATVAADSPTHANEVVVIDPASATVIGSAFVGSDPNGLALSDDGSTLWVGLDGSREVRRVSMTDGDPEPAESHALPLGEFGDPSNAGPMVVLPGTTHSLAISLHRWDASPSFSGLAIMDDGVPRPVQTPGHTGAARLTGGPEGFLYGFNNLHTGFGFYAIAVEPNGPVATEFEGLVDGFDADIVFSEGFVFASDGSVVDVSEPAEPRLAGSFPFAGRVIPDLSTEVLMLSPPEFGTTLATLRTLDRRTFTQSASSPLDLGGDVAILDFVSADGFVLAVLVSDWFDESSDIVLVLNPFAENGLESPPSR